jgi:SAM-dependent methyltransferase
MECIVCRGNKGKEHTFREMMFGTRKEFDYWECFECGCMQISSVPEQLSDHYAGSYYSFGLRAAPWKHWFYRAHFEAPGLMRLLRRCSADISSVIAVKPKPRARILDVGCGGGRLVHILRTLGFEAHGVDPFLKADQPYLRNISLENADAGWDLIMFHHSLEHMQNHVDVLRCARSKLNVNGTCLVRIPVVSWAWAHYGRDWAQLDVPRHLVIHTRRSFELTAAAAGFQMKQIIFDSDEFQFSASECYQRDIPLHDKRASKQFSQNEIRRFRAHADKLNREQRGDQAIFFCTRE